MILQTGGRSVADTSTRSMPASRAISRAWEVGTMPCCSPSADQADRADADLFVQTGAGRAAGRGVAIERGDAWSPWGEPDPGAAATAAAGFVARNRGRSVNFLWITRRFRAVNGDGAENPGRPLAGRRRGVKNGRRGPEPVRTRPGRPLSSHPS